MSDLPSNSESSASGQSQPMSSAQCHDAFRLALSWLRAVRANSPELAGEILASFESREHAIFGLSVLLGLLADALPNIDEVLFSLVEKTSLESGDDWLIKPDSELPC
jgi:hypothetical protein